MLSVFSFAANLAVALYCSPEGFAVYTLVWSVLQLSAGLQNAAINMPMLANRASVNVNERESLSALLIMLSSVTSIVLAIAFLITMEFIRQQTRGGDVFLPIACGISLVGVWGREVRRAIGYIREEPKGVLRGDLAFASLAISSALGLAYLNRALSPAIVLTAIGLGGIATGTFSLPLTRGALDRAVHEWRSTKVRLLGQIGWTLPSVAMSWVQAYACSFFALSFGGLRSVAALNFARLTTTPASLLQGAWSRLFQPRAARMLAGGSKREAVPSACRGVWTVGVLTLLYGGAVLAVARFDVLPQVSGRMNSVLGLIALWTVYLLVAAIRGPATSLLTAAGRFRQLFLYGAITTTTTVVLSLVFGKWIGPGGLIGAMIAGELMLGALTWNAVRQFYSHNTGVLPLQTDGVRD